MMRQRVFMSEENEMNNLDSLRIQLANKEGQINQLEEHKEQLKQQLVEKEDKFDLPTINLKQSIKLEFDVKSIQERYEKQLEDRLKQVLELKALLEQKAAESQQSK